MRKDYERYTQINDVLAALRDKYLNRKVIVEVSVSGVNSVNYKGVLEKITCELDDGVVTESCNAPEDTIRSVNFDFGQLKIQFDAWKLSFGETVTKGLYGLHNKDLDVLLSLLK